MAEREVIIDKLRLEYEGLFDVAELYKLMDKYFRDKGYDKREKRNVEKVAPEGKYIELDLEPWKKITDYAKNIIKIRVFMNDVKEVEIEREGIKVKLNQGKIKMVFDAYLETDYEHRWEGKPLFFFLRTIFDKYIYSSYTEGYRKNVIEDTNYLYSTIKSFLNLYRYSDQAQTEPISSAEAPGH